LVLLKIAFESLFVKKDFFFVGRESFFLKVRD